MNQHRKIALSILVLGLTAMFAAAVIAAPLDVNIDFTGFIGDGFASGIGSPPAGQLDSDTWSTSGFSTDNAAFESDCTTGDCARGTSFGHVTTGGVYAFNVGGGNTILGVQPGGSDFTPGSFTLRMRNNTGALITSINVSYDIYYYNDQGRANSLNLSYSNDDSSYTSVPSTDFTTPEIASATPVWGSVSRSVVLNGLTIPDGTLFYLQWTGNDVSGGGSRDEYGIDNISITSLDPTAVSLQTFTADTQPPWIAIVVVIITLLILVSGGMVHLRRQ